MRTLVLFALVLLATAGPAMAATNLAVFNFQLKTGQEVWTHSIRAVLSCDLLDMPSCWVIAT